MKTRKQILSILLSIFVVVMMLPSGMVTAWAETKLDNNSTTWSEDSMIDTDVEINGGVTVNADIILNIHDGKTLTVNGGINAGGSTLTVEGTGKLIINGTAGSDGSNGGNGFTGNLVVNGADVTVSGGRGGTGGYGGTGDPGIPGGRGGSGGDGGISVAGTLTVYSGSATVTGGDGGSGGSGGSGGVPYNGYGGFGGSGGSGGFGGKGIDGTLTVYSGSATVTGGSGGSGGSGGYGGGDERGGDGGNGGDGGIGVTGNLILVNNGSATVTGGGGGSGGSYGLGTYFGSGGGDGSKVQAVTDAIFASTIEESDDNNSWSAISSGAFSTKQFVKAETTILWPAIQLVDDGQAANLEAGCNTENAATVWFGKDDNDNNASWRVIGYNGDGVASENGTITLLASKNMGLSNFGNNNQYKNSVLHYQMHTLDNKLTTKEKAAVVKRELNGNSANQGEDGYDSDHISGESVDDALYWPLSVAEAENVNEKIRLADPEHTSWRSSTWWLRTPGSGINEEAVVDADGEIINYGRSIFMNDIGIRPAFHLNLDSVLFTSAAEGGKTGDGALEPVYYYTDADWKLTLRDDTREFTVTEKSVTANPGQSVNLNYRNATVNNDKAPNEYISAILANKDDNLLYYGRLIKPIGPDGQISITIPNELEAGTYTLKLFSEQYNGDYITDYASDFSNVKLTVYSPVQDCPRDDTCPIAPFTDTNKNAWYHDGVHWTLQKAIMYGTSDNTFEPMTPTTRAMLVTMLWRMEGSPIVDYQMTFKDVHKSQWYTEPIRWAAAEGIVTGYNEETFGIDDAVTREQLATILYRLAQAKGKGFQGGWAFLLDFDDADQVSDWADEAMHWMVMKGVINGVSERELSPGTDAVRAQVATMLMRFNEKVS